MLLDEDALHGVSQNGELDYTKWPAIIEPLLERLNQIVYHEFPTPRPYPRYSSLNSHSQAVPTDTPSNQQTSVQISQTPNTPTTPRTLPPVPPFPGSTSTDTTPSHVPNSQPDHNAPSFSIEDTRPELPLIIVQQLNTIVATLRASFYTRPPHTIQRLSELTLDPKRHYKTLPAWLRAVDRVVSVSSTADIFPLTDVPAIINGVNGDGAGGILWNNGDHTRNGVEIKDKDGGLGSDESLGGALLTPIPWLRDVGSHSTADADSNGDLEGAGAGADDQDADDLLGEPIHIPSSDSVSPTSISNMSDSLSATDKVAAGTKSTAATTNSAPTPVSLHTSQDLHPLVPDRPLGAVTQGELIRMEQEAGVIPVTHHTSPSTLPRTGRPEHSPSIALGIGVGLDSGVSNRDEIEVDEDQHDVEQVHARGPDVVGTVDTGLVDGKGVEVKLGNRGTGVSSSSSSTDKNPSGSASTNVNDAQDVLSHGIEDTETRKSTNNEAGSASGGSSDGGYVDLGKEVTEDREGDEMQIDQRDKKPTGSDRSDEDMEEQREGSGRDNEDDDIVLVDADGATSEEREKLDASGLNVGDASTR